LITIKTKAMTQFETAVQQSQAGQLQVPTVQTSNGNINFFGYQLAVHKMNLGLMSKGMKCRGITLKDIKQYYGLKGKTAGQCLEEIKVLMDKFNSR
jgi:hypothetical protein